MPLTLSLLTDTDVHAFAVVDDAAMADWPYARAMGLNLPGPRIQMVEDWVRQGLTTDSTQTYLKVEDDETGEMVAGALWRFDDGVAVKRRMGEEGKKEGEENLQILVTTPAHRRRGAASKLIKWGTQRADERGLKSVLMASEAGLRAYLKHGFKVVREVEMDLRPYGVEATELRRWMVREHMAVVRA
ncbi:hypothetical protein Q7P35_010008 [Cladosporium inversicolor]